MDEHLLPTTTEFTDKLQTHLTPKDGVIDARVMFDLVNLLRKASEAVRPPKGQYRRPQSEEVTPEQAIATERAEARMATIEEQSQPLADELKHRVQQHGPAATANEVAAAEAQIQALSDWLRSHNLGLRVRPIKAKFPSE